jgi:hypothetical protein
LNHVQRWRVFVVRTAVPGEGQLPLDFTPVSYFGVGRLLLLWLLSSSAMIRSVGQGDMPELACR